MNISLEETCGDEELLHGHGVHAGEVLLHQLLAVVPVAQAEVLLQVDPELNNNGLVVNHFHFQCIITIMPFTTSAFIKSPELRNHDGVFQVSLHPLQALDALVASVPEIYNFFFLKCFYILGDFS